MRRLFINITPAERAGRVLLGTAAALVGVLLLVSASGSVTAALDVLLVLDGLDLLITDALGHCPLYAKIGYVPRSFRRTP